MSAVSLGTAPASRFVKLLVLGTVAALLAFAYMAASSAGSAQARDIVISDSSSPLSAGATPNFAGTTVTAGSPAATQNGSCTTPNVSIRGAALGPASDANVRDAIQKAVNPASMGVQAGDNVYFCNIAATGTGTPATNTYAPAENGNNGYSIDLSVTPSVNIAAYPGQTPILQANRGPQPAINVVKSQDGAGQNNLYTVTFTDNPVNGSFTLTLTAGGSANNCSGTTTALPWNATAAQIAIAIANLNESSQGVCAAIGVSGNAPGTVSIQSVGNSTDGDDSVSAIAGTNNNLVGGSDASFFIDSSTQGRDFTLADLILSQPGAATGIDGGFIRINNSVNPGNLLVDNVTADGFNTAGSGGVIQAENIEVVDSAFGTVTGNQAGVHGGVIDAGGDVEVIDSQFGDQDPAPNTPSGNSADGDGGAINASSVSSSVIVDGSAFEGNVAGVHGGAIAANGPVEVIGDDSAFIGLRAGGVEAINGNGGAIDAIGVLITNGTLFGVDTSSGTPVGFGLDAGASGGAIMSYSAGDGVFGTGCQLAVPDPAQPCVPGTVEVTGPAVFGGNSAGDDGGAILAQGGMTIDGETSGATFTAGSATPPSYGNTAGLAPGAAGKGGAIAVGGLFRGDANAAPAGSSPRTCVSPTSITNLAFTRQATDVTNGDDGGAIQVLEGATDRLAAPNGDPTKRCAVEITDNVFTANFADNDGGALGIKGGAVTTSNEYVGNISDDDGGAVSIEDVSGPPATTKGTLADSGSTYTDNETNATGLSGGAIWIAEAARVSITNGVFEGNQADDEGGAIRIDEEDLSPETGQITGNTFTDNRAGLSGDGDGGAIYSDDGDQTISQNTFVSNAAGTAAGTGDGGAIYVDSDDPTITDNEFVENTATGTGGGNGGAIGADTDLGGAPSSISQNEFLGNAASLDGGAIYTEADLTVSESLFSENYATQVGGAVFSIFGTLTITEAAFELNASLNGGGAITSGVGRTVLNETAFVDNKAGVSSTGAYVTAGNTADGGALLLDGTYRITESAFVGNEAANNGGAIEAAANGGAAGDGIILSGFAENAAGVANAAQASVGGAVNFSTAAQNVVDSEFLLNEVTQTNTNAAAVTRGGAIAATDDDIEIEGSTIAGNSVSSAAAVTAPAIAAAGGGVYMASANTVTSTNSTYTENEAPVAPVAWLEANSTLTFTSSTIAGNGTPLDSPIIVAGSTAGTLEIGNSIIDQGEGVGSACAANTLTNDGGNVLTDTTACGDNAFVGTGGAPAAKVSAEALELGPLADNGGPTDTMAIGFDSVARTSAGVNLLGANPVDQRGLERPDTNQSSGAYQLTLEALTLSKAGAGSGTVVSDPAGIDCGPGCQNQTGQFAATPPETLVTLTATAEPGSEFQSWTGDCAEISGNVCVVDADAVNNITANFSTNLNRLTVINAGNGEGSVTSSPAGIDCGTTCEADFESGTTVTLTAAASGQSAFAGWSGACASAGLSATCQVTMDQARSVTASFTQSAAVRISKVRSGTIRVPRNRVISVGKVTCVNGTCSIEQATATVRARGVTYRAQVRRPSGSFTTGQSRTVKVVVPKAAFNRLTRKKSGSVSLVLRAKAQVPDRAAIERNRNISNGLKR